jgi:hypothetical protein
MGQPDDPAGTGAARERSPGVASDGRALDSLLDIPAQGAVEVGWRRGTAPDRALASRRVAAGACSRETTVQDAGRQAAVSAGSPPAPRVGGHVRMLTPPSCSRCVILAGRWYRWSTGFKRHPLCDCRMIPASEDAAHDLTTDSRAYFKSLSAAEQDKTFTKAGAESIRLGADINQVVKARRGALGLTPANAGADS